MIDNLDEINMKVMKYHFAPILGSEPSMSGLTGDRANNTQNNAAPAFVEISKLEKFSMIWPVLHKLSKPLELIVGFLAEMKNIFKPCKCTMFIIDKGM